MKWNGIKIFLIIVVLLVTVNLPTFFTSNDTIKAQPPIDPPIAILPGDIIMMDLKPGVMPLYWFFYYIPGPIANDHCAMCVGTNEYIHAGGTGVAVRDYSYFLEKFSSFALLRVTSATPTQRQNAVEWALSKQGLGYQVMTEPPHFFQKCEDPNRIGIPGHNLFYCMELPWAAYYNQGIDIDCNEWTRDSPILMPGVWGNDIINDGDIQVLDQWRHIDISPFEASYLDISDLVLNEYIR